MGSLGSVLIAALGGYLAGSVSFSLVLARGRGVDLRSFGSGNPGATNAGRALGRPYGIAVYLLDALKGLLPTLAAWLWLGGEAEGEARLWPAVAAAAGAFAGHVWPLYHGFRGGKGVATLSGAMIVLDLWAVLVAGAALLVVVKATRFMALGSLLFGLVLPLAVWALDPAGALGSRRPVLLFAAAAGPFLFYTHRSNVGRLLSGTENRLGGGGR